MIFLYRVIKYFTVNSFQRISRLRYLPTEIIRLNRNF